MHRYIAFCCLLGLAACQEEEAMPVAAETASATAAAIAPGMSAEERLDAVLANQSDDAKARYQYRNPKQTLTFFGIKPGMTVVEGLPGTGWYSSILVPYLGPEGKLIGANYAYDMWPLFGFFSDEFIAGMKTWTTTWPELASQSYPEKGAKVAAFEFGKMPEELAGTADAVLMIRASHNLARFESQGGFMSQAMADLYKVLKPGGTLGVVQHWGPDELPDEWADGSKGYLKRDFVIQAYENGGFEFIASSPVNHNHRDQPTAEDIVWRLPPTLATSNEDPELRKEMQAIGESNRMTLKFKKPM